MRERGPGSGDYTHGGLVFHTPFDLPPSLLPYHDQVGPSWQISVVGGVSSALSGSTEVYAICAQSVYGRAGHKVDNGLNFGVTYSFSPSQLVRRYFSHKPAATP